MKNIRYLFLGIVFGVILTKAEVISWFRIQEMFRFQSIHMYGIIGSAVVVGAVLVFIIRRLSLKTIDGETVTLPAKRMDKGVVIGGTIFGLGWALTGACPGPLYALVGSGTTVMIVGLASALLGTWTYGALQKKLPH
ncbi:MULTISPECIES: DUF6691 family protein [unclassified Imperialibacter]|uniref:DUF6691 family protein n=1 Tax=unclassified Imperialibacter TaxID=2629706 RepID=UPI001251FF60|nr:MULTISPECIES: DUF6691 family protein [unclassified Imperialibacter]CAD5282154.1 Transporter [Imperialibacter sp. 89]CAD5287447.1 Transporter [Imperialibacter sp. 75]VVT30699.1 Transporter [Imperialibacter sp. EC-SDR9]